MNPLFHKLFQQNRYLTNQLNDVLQPFGLFSSQWTIIYCLAQHETMTLTQIWRYINVEAPTVTRTVNRLEKLGWVRRVEGMDKREKIIALTSKAQQQLPRILVEIQAFEAQMLGSLTEEEQRQFMRLLQKMKG